jgi:hypothetical protein
MAHTIVRDVVIWTKHVHGDDTAARLEALPAETEITLIVDGVRGFWCKMRNGKDGRPTSGFRPVGRAKTFWQGLFDARRGDSVTVEFETQEGQGSSGQGAGVRRAEEREAARAAVLSAPSLGWTSEGRTMTRDALYER